MDPVTTVVWVVAFVLVTVCVTGFTGRIGWSAPVALVAVGAVASFIPAVPRVEIEPELVLYGVIPPLLFAAAIRTSFIDIRARNDSILALSVGLVAFTVVVVGFTTWMLVPAITLAAAFAFGAVVAPTDAVAVSAVAGRLKLPRRLVTILEGESLLNDATALVALNAAIMAIVSVTAPDPWSIAGNFTLAVVGGVAVGLAIGWGLSEVRKRLRAPVLDTSLSLITPYLAFIIAQAIGGSGVLAVVVAGILLGYRSPTVQSAEARIAERLNWKTIQFLLENAVFLFIGLNLAGIVEGASTAGPGLWPTVLICLGILLTLIVSRFVWVFALTWLYRHGPRFLRVRQWSWRNATAVSAAGIRGVVTLIAVFLLPPETPQREFLQFLAFVVVVGTLLEGLALPRLLKVLKLPTPDYTQEHSERMLLMAEAEDAGVVRLEQERTDDDELEVIDRLRANAAFLAEALQNPPTTGGEPRPVAYTRLRKVMIEAQREAVLKARHEGRYQEAAVLSVLAAIDAEETALRTAGPKAKPAAASDARAPKPRRRRNVPE
ncbi:Na+/H+ antiporter [Leifsonia sp. Leaf264]|uniref:Na+/H+ antiporter n=1 Tax=Leifsonia sp. Leaf264 TaxID=1736314 RepID=UPI0009E7BC38|nr:Na+/H+ antiporter [Leifsonia sp. Leaf264]